MESKNINYLDIKGYATLSVKARQTFDYVDRKHLQCVEDTEAWTPVKVKERKDCIEVYFKNCQWLRYLPNGTWH